MSSPNTLGTFVVCWLMVLFVGECVSYPSIQTFQVDERQVLQRVSTRFISVTLNAGLIRGNWASFQVNSTRTKVLLSALSPGYLRFGGNLADTLVYKRHAHSCYDSACREMECQEIAPRPQKEEAIADPYKWYEQTLKDYNTTIITRHDLHLLSRLATDTDHVLIFDLNAQLRNSRGHWDSENGQQIVDFLTKYGEKRNPLVFQLGNEPDSYRKRFGKYIDPKVMFSDTEHLGRMLSKGSRYLSNQVNKSSLNGRTSSFLQVVGPETTSNQHGIKFIRSFSNSGNLRAFTFHHYYMNGRIATKDIFTDFAILDRLQSTINLIKDEDHFKYKTLWNTESGSTYGGGTLGLSNSYIAGFMWLDKLGVMARNGVKVVARQSFYGGRYALLDKNNDPNPDYWLTLLHKKLVGTRVLNLTLNVYSYNGANPQVRLYAHCSRSHENFVVFGMNLGTNDVVLMSKSLTTRVIESYVLEPLGKDGLLSTEVALNGEHLQIKRDHVGQYKLPELKGRFLDNKEPVILPAKRLFFFVVSQSIRACLNTN